MSAVSPITASHAASQVATAAAQSGTQVSDWLAPGSLSFELVKGMPAAFVALIIGSIAAGIAYRQYKIAHAKLKLDLFEQRYELYMLLWKFLSEGTDTPSPNDRLEFESSRQLRAKYSNAIPQAYFLFGQETGEFFDLVDKKFIEHNLVVKHLRQLPSDGPKRSAAEEAVLSLEHWINDTRTTLKDRLRDYMSFEQWRG